SLRKIWVDLRWGVRAPAPTCAAMESKLEVTMCKNRRSALRPLPNIRDLRRDGFGNSSARFSRRQVFYFHRRAAFHGAQNRRSTQIRRSARERQNAAARKATRSRRAAAHSAPAKAARENGGKSIECRFAEEMSA